MCSLVGKTSRNAGEHKSGIMRIGQADLVISRGALADTFGFTFALNTGKTQLKITPYKGQIGEGYGTHTEREVDPQRDDTPAPTLPLAVALIPLIMVIGLNALFTYGVFPAMDLSYISDAFENITPSRQTGLWAILISLLTISVNMVADAYVKTSGSSGARSGRARRRSKRQASPV